MRAKHHRGGRGGRVDGQDRRDAAHFPYTSWVPNYTTQAYNGDPTVTSGAGAYDYDQLDTALSTYRSNVLGSSATRLEKTLQLAGINKFGTNTALVTTSVARSANYGTACIQNEGFAYRGKPPIGDVALGTKSDYNAAGIAEASKVTASATASVTKLSVWVDAGNAATKLVAGIYADASGHPGQLLAQGSLNSPVAGQFNTVTLGSAASVTASSTYWIAILGTGDQLNFTIRPAAAIAPTETSSSSSLTSLPATWTTGQVGWVSVMSAYAE